MGPEEREQSCGASMEAAGRAGADGRKRRWQAQDGVRHFRGTYDTPEAALATAVGGRYATLEDGSGSVRDENGADGYTGYFTDDTGAHPSPRRRPTTPSTRRPTPTATTTLIITVAEVPAGIPEYDRGQWKHWVDEDGDCQDARQEVLIAESLEEVTYEADRQCRVEWGRWWAPYLQHHLGNPGHIDVDHTVPLRNAHLSGAWAWSPEEKERYANDLTDPDHLN